MEMRLTERRDYELYVRKTVDKNLKLGLAFRNLVVALAMQSFDDGMKFGRDKHIEVSI